MTIHSLIISLLDSLALGQSLLAALILFPQTKSKPIYFPLGLFFLANVVTELASVALLPLVFDTAPLFSALLGFSAIPFHCLLAPLFWIYVRGLTSEHPQVWHRRDIGHLGLGFITLTLPVLAATMPSADLLMLFEGNGDRSAGPSTAQWLLINANRIIDSLVILQVGLYIVLIIIRLGNYRSKLTQLFASTEHLELKWFRWLAAFMLAYFILTALALLSDNLFQSPHSFDIWEALIDVALLSTICVWGLRQQPGLAIETQATMASEEASKKYRHSALSDEQSKIVASKIRAAMEKDQLYRQDNVSLRILAQHLGELPSYVTQSLNTQIGQSFFDYINHWRIEEAAQRLVNSQETVLAIAIEVGFNSRSSFYSAFKKNKGTTPSAFRKQYCKS